MKKTVMLLMCGLAWNCFSGDDFKGEAAIRSVQAGNRENKNDEHDVLFLKFNTFQRGEPYVGILRVMMEFSEKASGRIFAGSAREVINMGEKVNGGHFKGYKYTGEVSWEFETDVNDLKRPKVTAYAIQYGYDANGTFQVLEEECYHVDSYQELDERTKSSTERKLKRESSRWIVD